MVEKDTLNILIADPDEEFADKLKKKLEFWFREFVLVYTTTEKEQIIPILQGREIDFLITEVEWGIDPADFIDSLVNEPVIAETMVVVISNYSEIMFENYVYKNGIIEFFHKKNLDYFLLENKLRNYFRIQFNNKILFKQISDSIRSLQIARGISEEQIQELREMVIIMKEELEREYKNKIRLEEEKKKIQTIFGLYVDPNIINGIISGEIPLEQKGVEREISVLFADIRGYTAIAEKMKPTDVVSFLNEYFTAMTEVILSFNGLIDKYIGDAIMAIFGAPLPNEAHRDLALQAAMEMQSVFELWNQNWKRTYGIDAKMGIGVASGVATLGNFGSFQKLSYTAIGDTVNIAARLESIAGPSEVLANENLVMFLSDEIKKRYQFEEIPSIELKGKIERIKAYRVK
ncbi:MAG: adenylate/guanylate cyclase domain-containing protein [Leptospiraceae bacterium]|nr:adenylate/guanylate cyclase domain-containing protein [Leptospiraceae bacterium]MDW7976709.1 adenylate/guanylate cyclase domain-containing protein [Leptospiraceae bacterium]